MSASRSKKEKIDRNIHINVSIFANPASPKEYFCAHSLQFQKEKKLHTAKFESHSFKNISVLRENSMSGFLCTMLVEHVIINTQLAVNNGHCTSSTIANSGEVIINKLN